MYVGVLVWGKGSVRYSSVFPQVDQTMQKSIFAYCDFLMIHSFTYSGTFYLVPVPVNMLVIRAGDLHIKL